MAYCTITLFKDVLVILKIHFESKIIKHRDELVKVNLEIRKKSYKTQGTNRWPGAKILNNSPSNKNKFWSAVLQLTNSLSKYCTSSGFRYGKLPGG